LTKFTGLVVNLPYVDTFRYHVTKMCTYSCGSCT